MIVKMKRGSLLCLESDRDRTLEALRNLGVMHLLPVQPPAGADLDALLRKADEVEKAIAILAPIAAKGGGAVSDQSAPGPDELATLVLSESRRLADLDGRIVEIEKEILALEPFGDFDPESIRQLAASGVSVRLFTASSFEGLDVPPEAVVHVLRQTKGSVAFALVSRSAASLPGLREFQPPSRSLAAATKACDQLKEERAAVSVNLRRLAKSAKTLNAIKDDVRERLAFSEARAGMGQANRIAYIQGYCPDDTVPAVQAEAKRMGWALLVEDPASDEQVPTLLRMPAWVKPIKPVLDMLGIVPGYGEVDVSSVFLLFFSLFFAMLIGDAGYGLLFLGLTLFLKFKLKQPPPNLIPLLGVLSGTTIVWGLLTGSFFFIQNLPAPLARFKIQWLGNEQNIQSFCFLLGAIHLTIAHAWNLLLQIRTLQALAQIGWICLCWTMYYVACYLVLGQDAPGFLMWLFLTGLLLVTVFMTPLKKLKTEWSNHVMLPLSVINNFGDIVSYLRLFLVGSASVTLILAFNEMAIGSGISGFVSGLVAALIIFAAHTLNIVLGLLAVLVHGVRLNALEFSTHFGIQWSGSRFKPFARKEPL